ncbi:VOC family protein [Enterococcus hulanensis]|uniref:VOC family protein n=1 Tax=Enterococcus hulanensis TaxID=2559929 RepID=A0ABU3F518_9ENTE|nr:VOC family protein [Enterococcus hulanensis]MDT2602012.1 VOC family protein [Enterococcus hulanensis]MDT2611283.1 VOC family protein [Enterococcus hulanensis]MDT2615823.1 VOC family protein [Enterococcus hulanensis]MDT2630084.1 VOC family protein [Enterococcus hulanensis]MDT2657565.1 VOC family protein [Enterococcus hulanensis]
MFNEEVKVILYANDVKKASSFWQSLGFVEISFEELDGSQVAEVAMSKNSTTHLVIYDRAFIEKNDDEVTEPSPALIFGSDDVVALYKKLQTIGVQLGDLAQIGEEYVFNFVDADGNYFVVSGR